MLIIKSSVGLCYFASVLCFQRLLISLYVWLISLTVASYHWVLVMSWIAMKINILTSFFSMVLCSISSVMFIALSIFLSVAACYQCYKYKKDRDYVLCFYQ